jgi:hypothetical protein
MGLEQRKDPSLTINIPSTAIVQKNNTGRIDPKGQRYELLKAIENPSGESEAFARLVHSELKMNIVVEWATISSGRRVMQDIAKVLP